MHVYHLFNRCLTNYDIFHFLDAIEKLKTDENIGLEYSTEETDIEKFIIHVYTHTLSTIEMVTRIWVKK